MRKYVPAFAVALTGLLTAGGASAQSSFTQTCSNYGFAYSGVYPVLEATCLKNSGDTKQTSLTLNGIVTVNGVLTDLNSSVPSNFQINCGSIKIAADGPYVTLSAYCINDKRQFNETSILLNNINNIDGDLVQGKAAQK
jgi:hypothetical protein